MLGYHDPDPDIRLAWGWNWWEIVDAFRRGEPLRPWMARDRGIETTARVLPVVLPIKGSGAT